MQLPLALDASITARCSSFMSSGDRMEMRVIVYLPVSILSSSAIYGISTVTSMAAVAITARDSRSPDMLKADLSPYRLSGLGVPGGMALHGQALGHGLLLGVPQNAAPQPLFSCESENWASEFWSIRRPCWDSCPGLARSRRPAGSESRTAGREVLLVNDFVLHPPTMETTMMTEDE